MSSDDERYFGEFGGRFVAEPLQGAVDEVAKAWHSAWNDPGFRGDFEKLLNEYANRFATFNRFTNAPLAKYQDRLYHMPFNMNTFYAMWGVTKPNEAREIIEQQRTD